MKDKTASYQRLGVLGWSLIAALLLTLALLALSTDESIPGLDSREAFAQEGPDDGGRGQGLCPDGKTAVPDGVDKIEFCRDNGKFPPVPDFVEDLWCRLVVRFRMFVPFGFRYSVICLEEGPPLPPGIREVDFRIVTLIQESDGQEIKDHAPPLFWKLLNARDFASPDDNVVLLRWNEDVDPARWDFVPGSKNGDGTIDYLVNKTSLFAVGLSDDPKIAQTFIAPETVIPTGLPRTGSAGSPVPWRLGLGIVGLAVLAAVGLWRWRGHRVNH